MKCDGPCGCFRQDTEEGGQQGALAAPALRRVLRDVPRRLLARRHLHRAASPHQIR